MWEINLEAEATDLPEAMRLLDFGLRYARELGEKTVLVIHGYGSTGRGGALRTAARKRLRDYEKNGRVKAMIEGEEYQLFSEKARLLHASLPETNRYYGAGNHGVTLVRL